MSFSAFQKMRQEVSYSNFLSSSIAQENGIDESWYPNQAPVSFLVYDNHCWIAKYEQDGQFFYETHIEREERRSVDLRSLEIWLFQFFAEEGCDF